MDIFSQMMRLPFDVVAMSLEPLLRMARDPERFAGREMLGRTPALMPRSVSMPSPPAAGVPVTMGGASALLASTGASRKDDMNDNLVKLVRYSIVFTKPDAERILSED